MNLLFKICSMHKKEHAVNLKIRHSVPNQKCCSKNLAVGIHRWILVELAEKKPSCQSAATNGVLFHEGGNVYTHDALPESYCYAYIFKLNR